MYDEYAPRVYAYALRHCGPVDADDVVAETFAVAWRRIDVVPDPAIGWLIVTARNVVNGRRRTDRKHVDLARLAAESSPPDEPAAEEVAVRRREVLDALDALSEREREALLLTAWDGLDHAAAVAGCSTRAFRARLMRARARLRSDVLVRATADRPRRTRRALRVGVAGAVAAAVGLGGVAYATDSAPAWLTNVTDRFAEYADVPVAERPDMAQVVDLHLPDGSRFAAWRGISDEMWCTAYVDRWDGQSGNNGRGSCSDSGPAEYDELARIRIAWAGSTDESTYYPVLFGDAYDDAAAVRVTGRFARTGEQVDLTLPVDPETGAFAGVLPGTRNRPFTSRAPLRDSGITLEFLDASGQVVRTVDGPAV
jgi:RNA polymerase sigma-70 factor (ECF subfamily)